MSDKFAQTMSLSLAETEALATRLAPVLRAGDTLLLSGQIGAGKTTFARALIRAWLGDGQAEVPSPTFTLVQSYERPGDEIWHCDLYRLTHAEELAELGLNDALPGIIALVEWPDQVATDWPSGALRLGLSAGENTHQLRLSGDATWAERFAMAQCLPALT